MLDKSKKEMDMQDLKDLGIVDIFEGLEDVADSRIKRALGSLGQRMKKRNGQEAGKIEKQSAPPSKTAGVVQLPCWPEWGVFGIRVKSYHFAGNPIPMR